LTISHKNQESHTPVGARLARDEAFENAKASRASLAPTKAKAKAKAKAVTGA
jgi:hypothetical protein